MNLYLVTAFNFSIMLPGIVAIFLFNKIERRYYPFLFCIWIGCMNECLSLWLIIERKQSLINSNIYVLFESLLLTWYFRKTSGLEARAFAIIISSLFLTWIIENFVFGNITANSTYFRIFASLVIVVLSLRFVGDIIFSVKTNILKNAEFILCCCFIVYFCFKAIIQAFVIYGSTRDMSFQVRIYNIMLYINLGVNLLYLLATIWMPRRVKYIFPSS